MLKRYLRLVFSAVAVSTMVAAGTVAAQPQAFAADEFHLENILNHYCLAGGLSSTGPELSLEVCSHSDNHQDWASGPYNSSELQNLPNGHCLDGGLSAPQVTLQICKATDTHMDWLNGSDLTLVDAFNGYCLAGGVSSTRPEITLEVCNPTDDLHQEWEMTPT